MNTAETTQVRRKKLAELTGVRDSTLKFYSEQGLLPFLQEGAGLTRRYECETAVKRLSEIQNLQAIGMNIAQIKSQLNVT